MVVIIGVCCIGLVRVSRFRSFVLNCFFLFVVFCGGVFLGVWWFGLVVMGGCAVI
jgi:hypothetical protein